jgi:hypothetical protein
MLRPRKLGEYSLKSLLTVLGGHGQGYSLAVLGHGLLLLPTYMTYRSAGIQHAKPKEAGGISSGTPPGRHGQGYSPHILGLRKLLFPTDMTYRSTVIPYTKPQEARGISSETPSLGYEEGMVRDIPL